MISRLRVTLFVLAATSAIAEADEATARQRYDDAEKAYNLGQFAKAIQLFTEAYEQWPESAFLFNIAQSYRQAGDCKQARFFYQRFLALKQDDRKNPIHADLQAEVEARIKELGACIEHAPASSDPPPTTSAPTTATPPQPPPTVAAIDEPHDAPAAQPRDDLTRAASPPVAASVLVVHAELGAGKLHAGNVPTPIRPAVALTGGYPLALAADFELELGAAATFTPIGYTASGASASGSLFGVFVAAGARYRVAPWFAARLDVGAGLAVISGLDRVGNPFTMPGSIESGAVITPAGRVAATAELALTDHLVVTATPLALEYSPAPAHFTSAISSLVAWSVLVGAGYRM